MDTICENRPADTTFDFFGAKLRLPVLAAPVGAMKLHYGDKYDDATYNDLLVSACRDAGILACTGDGIDAGVMAGAHPGYQPRGAVWVLPTVEASWDAATPYLDGWRRLRKADPVAVAMDIDGAGLPFLQNRMPPAGSKTVAELREIIEFAEKALHPQGHHEPQWGSQGHGGRCCRHRGVQPRRPGAGSVPRHGRGSAGHR